MDRAELRDAVRNARKPMMDAQLADAQSHIRDLDAQVVLLRNQAEKLARGVMAWQLWLDNPRATIPLEAHRKAAEVARRILE